MIQFRIAVFPEQVPEQNDSYLVGVDTESDRQCVQDLFVCL
ncbi:hypothetical protein [Chroococcidiopsis sp. CCALA 051]|nr:hypothetical protein [Chroococcidiopsis sp. CCALA 051]